MGFQPVPGVPEGNVGWTSLGGSGPITRVEVVEAGPSPRPGPARARGRDLGADLDRGEPRVAMAGLPGLPFHRRLGLSFTCRSTGLWAARSMSGLTGPDEDEPPDHDIGVRQWTKLPGGHAVYYRNAENYGALGIVALDTNLDWAGIGSRRFVAQKPEGPSEIAITFPQWSGSNTVLQARREYRVLRQPLLIDGKPGGRTKRFGHTPGRKDRRDRCGKPPARRPNPFNQMPSPWMAIGSWPGAKRARVRPRMAGAQSKCPAAPTLNG